MIVLSAVNRVASSQKVIEYIPFLLCVCVCGILSLFFFNFIFKLYKIVLVLPNIKMNPPQVYMRSPSWTLLPPPSPFHPSGSSQCTSPKHPASCIEPGLATRFTHDILHVSMPFSQIFPPSPSLTESIRLVTITLCMRQQKRHWCIEQSTSFNKHFLVVKYHVSICIATDDVWVVKCKSKIQKS